MLELQGGKLKITVPEYKMASFLKPLLITFFLIPGKTDWLSRKMHQTCSKSWVTSLLATQYPSPTRCITNSPASPQFFLKHGRTCLIILGTNRTEGILWLYKSQRKATYGENRDKTRDKKTHDRNKQRNKIERKTEKANENKERLEGGKTREEEQERRDRENPG